MSIEKFIAEPGLEEALKPVKVSEQVLSIIEKHALEEYPFECCGFLYGVDEGNRLIIVAKPVLNNVTENRQRRFEISPGDYLAAERYALNHDITLLGIYHSHPDHPAVPSIHDFRQAVPFFSYFIASVSEKRVEATRSWQLIDGFFSEEKIKTTPY